MITFFNLKAQFLSSITKNIKILKFCLISVTLNGFQGEPAETRDN